jgi:PTS system nitrogen regulatory IIA component
MAFIKEILTPARTLSHAPGASKKRVFEAIARVISEDQPLLKYEEVFAQLIGREKLGSTGLGRGIAIPHCRIDDCPQPLGTLLTLDTPIDFDAPDDQPVDLLFALLVPGEAHQQHLDILAGLAGLLSDQAFCEQLRAAPSDTSLFELATRRDG